MPLGTVKVIDYSDDYRVVCRLDHDCLVELEVQGPHDWRREVRTSWGDARWWRLKDLPKALETASKLIEERRVYVERFNDVTRDFEAIVEIHQIAATL